jgi:DNA-binding transcriptional ArsR family regulator
MPVIESSPFGGKTRTRVLIALRLMSESFPRELSRLLETSLAGVQQALRSLEADGLVSARTLGRVRLFRLNPRYYALDELERYLLRLANAQPNLRARLGALRRRPRRTGKSL